MLYKAVMALKACAGSLRQRPKIMRMTFRQRNTTCVVANFAIAIVPSRGRVCHYVMVFIRAGSITAMIIYIFAHVQWRGALNDRLARG